jgi:hypothetical protein
MALVCLKGKEGTMKDPARTDNDLFPLRAHARRGCR